MDVSLSSPAKSKPRLISLQWRIARKHLPLLTFGALGLGIIAVGVFAPAIATHDPVALDISEAVQPPSAAAWFGTDEAGRDVFSRTVWGTRLSLVSAALVLIIAASIGVLVGAVAGYKGGWVDQALMRLTDLFLAFPGLILAIAITAALGPSLENAVIAIGLVWWPVYARLVRSRILSVREFLFVEAARALGLSDARILFRHVLPQCWGIIVARMTVDIGYAILLTSSLSFLGLGGRPPAPEWGSMIATSRTYFFTYWWTATFPGLAIFVTVVIFSMLGDALYEKFGVKGGRYI